LRRCLRSKLFKSVILCIGYEVFILTSVENQLLLISYITLAAVIAMIYGMRRIFILERKIVRLEKFILPGKKPKVESVIKAKKRRKK